MLSTTMEKAVNEQINKEFYSAYLYLSMVAYFESLNLMGFAAWMRAQTQEEMFHGMKMFDQVNERGGRVTLDAIEKPETEWGSPLEAFDAALTHEQYVTGRINSLVDLARKESDHASVIFLQWFVMEQVEEESSVGAVVQQLRLIGDSANALLMLDRELGARIFTMPAAGGG